MIKLIISDKGIASSVDSPNIFLNKKLGDVIELSSVKYKITGASTNDGFYLVKGINCSGKSSMILRLNKKEKVRRTVYGRIINNNVSSINLVKVTEE